MRKIMTGVALFGVAACGQQQDEATNSAGPEQSAPSPDSANRVVDAGNTAAPSAPATPAPATLAPGTPIPALFQGRWGMVPADCTSTRGDAKGLVVIDAMTLSFYESRAVPKNIQIIGENEWRSDLSYSGEGQTWEEKATLTLSNQGKTLTMMADGPFTYQKCEAG